MMEFEDDLRALITTEEALESQGRRARKQNRNKRVKRKEYAERDDAERRVLRSNLVFGSTRQERQLDMRSAQERLSKVAVPK